MGGTDSTGASYVRVSEPTEREAELLRAPWADDCRGCLHYVDGARGFALRLHTPEDDAGLYRVTLDVLVAGVLLEQVVHLGGAHDSVRWAVLQGVKAAFNLLGEDDADRAGLDAFYALKRWHLDRTSSALGDWAAPLREGNATW